MPLVERPPVPHRPIARESSRSSPVSIVIVGLMIVAALRLGRTLVLPMVIAMLLTLTLRAPVRWLQRTRMPARLAAAVVIFAMLGIVGGSVALIASPAVEWAASAPKTMQTVEARVRGILKPLHTLERSAERVQAAAAAASEPAAGANAPKTVQIATPGMFTRFSGDAVAAVPAALTVVFLTYFLLANDALARRKLAGLLPGAAELAHRVQLLDEIELAASHFLVTVTAINIGVGTVTALALWAIGVPNPALWGAIAAVFNFVPYLGAMTSVTLIGVAALGSIDSTAHALLAPAAFLAIHLTESNFVTPFVLGRHLPLNTIAMFIGLLFFGWMWGIAGAVLAVPLTVCVRLVCGHVPALARAGELLDN